MTNIICSKCNKNPAKRTVEGHEGFYCYPCGGPMHTRIQERKKYELKRLKEGRSNYTHTCKFCKEIFEHNRPKVNFCSKACEKNSDIKNINANWASNPEYESCKNGINNNFHAGFAYTKFPSCLKKFNSVRG